MIDLKKIFLRESYESWKDNNWVHYSRTPYIQINPQQLHGDLAGIYLFPENFNAVSYWKAMPYKFTVSVPENMNVLDLSKMNLDDCIDLLKKMDVEITDELMKYLNDPKFETVDTMWSAIRSRYSRPFGSVADWNIRFRKLGYDAVFDDTKAIHSIEDQLVVLKPGLIKVLDMEQTKISLFNGVKMVADRILGMLKKRDGFIEQIAPKKKASGWSAKKQISTWIGFSNLPTDQQDSDDYRNISFNVIADESRATHGLAHTISVSVFSTPRRNYGVGATYNMLEPNWESVDKLEKEIDWVMNNKSKYAESLSF